MILSAESTIGNKISMKTTHPMHFGGEKKQVSANKPFGSFAETLNNALGKVNNLLADSNEMTQKMIDEPESVEIHNVMIAAQKAEISLSFTKAVRDEAIRAYRDLMNLR